MYGVKKLYKPASLEEALEILEQHPEAEPYAGGTDVLVRMRKRNEKDAELVAIGHLPELKGVMEGRNGIIRIGACETFASLAKDPVITEKLPALRTAALAMGGPQIQNVATIGGNICNGAVSADSAPALFSLDALLMLQTAGGMRVVPISEFYLGPGKVDRKPGEILVTIMIPPRGNHYGCVYEKFATRKAMDLAILGTATTVEVDEQGFIRNCGIALGVAAPTPIRCGAAERYLMGRKPADAVLATAGALALTAASPRDSWRASKRYRQALIKELTGRVVKQAWEKAVADLPAEAASLDVCISSELSAALEGATCSGDCNTCSACTSLKGGDGA